MAAYDGMTAIIMGQAKKEAGSR